MSNSDEKYCEGCNRTLSWQSFMKHLNYTKKNAKCIAIWNGETSDARTPTTSPNASQKRTAEDAAIGTISGSPPKSPRSDYFPVGNSPDSNFSERVITPKNNAKTRRRRCAIISPVKTRRQRRALESGQKATHVPNDNQGDYTDEEVEDNTKPKEDANTNNHAFPPLVPNIDTPPPTLPFWMTLKPIAGMLTNIDLGFYQKKEQLSN